MEFGEIAMAQEKIDFGRNELLHKDLPFRVGLRLLFEVLHGSNVRLSVVMKPRLNMYKLESSK